MTNEQLIERIESRYIQGMIDIETAVDLINELRQLGE